MTHVRLNRLERMARSIVRQIASMVGAATLVLALLLAADHVGAAPWRTETATTPQSPAGDGVFTMPYQGRLTDAAGTPVDNMVPGLAMTFALYTQETGGAPVWSEHHSGVPVSDGLFNVYLGSITPLESALFGDDLWLGVTIGGDAEMTPREHVTWQPSAGVPVGTVISWWRPDASTPLPSDEWAIADGSVVSDAESPYHGQSLPDLTSRFVMGVTATDIGQTGGANTLDLRHRHTVDSHTHSIPSHTHNYNHDHGTSDVYCVGGGSTSVHRDITSLVNHAGSGTDTGAWSGTSGASQPNTNHQLSSDTDNRPAYVGLLFLVRIK